MTPALATALRDVHEALDRLQDTLADTEPAPIGVVLVQARDGGKVHRAARIEGIAGLMSYEGDNLDSSDYRVVPDLSRMSDEADLCRRCFGILDDLQEQDRS